MGQYTAPVVSAVLICSGLVIAYWYYRRRLNSQRQAIINKVVFFPDKATAKLLSRRKCKQDAVSLRDSSLSCFMEALQDAQFSLDVCMFTIACRELSEILIRAHRDGLIVRVIMDVEQTRAIGSQLVRMRRAGIEVRTDNTSYFMHHKFVLIDGKMLINGSLNWTLQGVCGNQENIIITNNPELVQPFVKKFGQLWDLYSPVKPQPRSHRVCDD